MDWKTLKRHPLSAEYRDLTGPAWASFCERMQAVGFLKGFAIVLDDGMVLDGWQRLRACIELGIEPTFGKLPSGITPEDYVASVNDERRHETAEEAAERIAARRERVAAAREAGKSQRAIAEEENVSRSTIVDDIEASGGPPCPPDGITGKDGKEYPVVPASPIYCEACKRRRRVGQKLPKRCEMCIELRGEAKEKKAKKQPKEETFHDKFGVPVPRNLRGALKDPWIQNAIDAIERIEKELRHERLADGMAKRKEVYRFFVVKDFVDGVGMAMNTLDELLAHLKEFRPVGVCPSCSGSKCSDCKLTGLVPESVHKKLSKK